MQDNMNIQTGFRSLDRHCGGLRPGSLTVIAASPQTGKTSFLISLAANINGQGLTAGLFSLEFNAGHVRKRAALMGLSLDNGDARTIIDDTPGISLKDLAASAVKMKEDGAAAILIDYASLISVETDSYEKMMDNIISFLKDMAARLSIPVVVAMQGARPYPKYDKREPHPVAPPSSARTFRSCPSVRDRADLILFLHLFSEESGRKDVRYDTTPEHDMELIIAKNYDGGPTLGIPMAWDSEHASVREYGDGTVPYSEEEAVRLEGIVFRNPLTADPKAFDCE